MIIMRYDLIVITGAGGVGKSTILNLLKNKLKNYYIFEFDEGGVPDIPTVEWRKERTNYWLQNLFHNNKKSSNVPVLCGLCLPSEIKESPFFNNSITIKYILLYLRFELLQKRLLELRQWPEYLIQGQKIWQERLIKEISNEPYNSIIDVENKTTEDLINLILELILH